MLLYKKTLYKLSVKKMENGTKMTMHFSMLKVHMVIIFTM